MGYFLAGVQGRARVDRRHFKSCGVDICKSKKSLGGFFMVFL